MISLPKRLPESGRYRGLRRWLNQLRAAVEARQLVPGVGTQITTSTQGTTVTAKASTSVNKPSGEATWL